MSQTIVFEDGRWNGRTAREWLPEVVEKVVQEFDPLRILLFGSLARGDEDRDSDIDLLVVFPEVENKREARIALRRATAELPVPVDFVVTHPDEIARRGDLVGDILRPALREGEVVYERAA